MVLVLTGPVHGGKTTFLARSLRAWRARGLVCEGFLSPAASDGTGDGYDLLEIGSGRRRPYLRSRGAAGAERVGPFLFVPEALERARAILREAPSGGLLIVDEVGPLELEGGGLWPVLREALAARPGPVLLVVRAGILDEVAARLAPPTPLVVDVRDPDAGPLLERHLFAMTGPA
jgi:nucleoside-triphosphatase THEP1